MAKFVFAPRPKTFNHTVKWKDLDGTNNELAVVFNTRTRTQFGEMFDEMIAESKSLAGRPADETTMAEVMQSTSGNNAKYLLAAVASWELEDPLSTETAQRLANEYPAAANAIMEAYRTACLDGRLGN